MTTFCWSSARHNGSSSCVHGFVGGPGWRVGVHGGCRARCPAPPRPALCRPRCAGQSGQLRTTADPKYRARFPGAPAWGGQPGAGRDGFLLSSALCRQSRRTPRLLSSVVYFLRNVIGREWCGWGVRDYCLVTCTTIAGEQITVRIL